MCLPPHSSKCQYFNLFSSLNSLLCLFPKNKDYDGSDMDEVPHTPNLCAGLRAVMLNY
jgi:hypothetical protein